MKPCSLIQRLHVEPNFWHLRLWFLYLLIQICVAVSFVYRIRNDSSLQYSEISVVSGQMCNLELPEFFLEPSLYLNRFPTCFSLLWMLACESKFGIALLTLVGLGEADRSCELHQKSPPNTRLPAGNTNYCAMNAYLCVPDGVFSACSLVSRTETGRSLLSQTRVSLPQPFWNLGQWWVLWHCDTVLSPSTCHQKFHSDRSSFVQHCSPWLPRGEWVTAVRASSAALVPT